MVDVIHKPLAGRFYAAAVDINDGPGPDNQGRCYA